MAHVFYSWNTTKTPKGFEAIVGRNTARATPNEKGRYCDYDELQRVTCTSRAIAKTHAIKWCNYYRAQDAAT